MGAVAGGQGRHHAVVSDLGRLRVYCAQAPQASPRQRRPPKQHMPWRVRLLAADPASGGRALHVVALLATRRRSTADPVEVLLRAAPVAGPELVYVHRGEAILFLDRARPSVPHISGSSHVPSLTCCCCYLTRYESGPGRIFPGCHTSRPPPVAAI